MKEPIEKPGRPVRPIPGGKALARLEQFVLERGLTTAGAEPRVRGSAKRRGTAAKRSIVLEAAAAPLSDYLSAFTQNREMLRLAPPQLIQAEWRPLGPYAVPHGQTYGSGAGSRPAVAGRVSAVAVDPSNPAHLLIGAASGGVWESHDGGTIWRPRTDGQPSLAMGAIAFDPSNPLVVFAGTGEGDFFSWLGAGLLRSTDGGTTWALLAAAPFVGRGFYDLVVDPLDGNHVLAGATNGLFESIDGGTTWTQRRAFRTWSISVHPAVAGEPNSTQEMFATCQDGLYRSTDGGTAWTGVALPSTPAGMSRSEVRHAPSDGDVVYVFAAAGTTAYLWRRDTFAGAFALDANPVGVGTGQAWYDWFAGVAPNNPDVVYLGGIEAVRGDRSAGGTWTWTGLSAKATGHSIHPDQHAVAFSPTNANVVYIGNDGGIYVSPDTGITWRSLNQGLCITEFEYLAEHPAYDAWLLGGTQDNGTLRYEGEEVWYHVQDGDGGDCGLNDAAPYTCFHTFFGMGMERSTTGGGWGSWAWIGPTPPAGHSALFYPPLEVNGNLVVQAGSRIFLSTDAGTTWNSVALPASGTQISVATALAAPSASVVYAGTQLGDIYRVQLVGTTWQAPVVLTRPRPGYVSDLIADPTNANRLWVTYSMVGGGHVYRSDDGGTTWLDVSAGLPNIPVNAIELDPSHPDTLWIAADVGVYRTDDAGATWAAYNNGLPNALAKDLLLHGPARLLRVALQSRGVWEIQVDQPQLPDVEVFLRDSVVDRGWQNPSPSGVADPFQQGSNTYFWQCTDIKVDSPPYQTPLAAEVDFEFFEDDHGIFSSGLQHENTTRGRSVRVFVHVHNRGVRSASNVAVKVFFADASLGLPDLPAGFWNNFPNNVLPVVGPWQAIAPHVVLPAVEPGIGRIAAFDWSVPAAAADHSCLLAVVTADNDSIATSELGIGPLVRGNKKCGLKNLLVVNPPPLIGPRVQAVKLRLWGTRRRNRFQMALDRTPAGMLKGIVLTRRLTSRLRLDSRRVPATLRVRRPDDDDKAILAKLFLRHPGLAELFDLRRIFVPVRRGVFLKDLTVDPARPEDVIVLLDPAPKAGRWALLLQGDDGEILGGFSFETNRVEQVPSIAHFVERRLVDAVLVH